MLLVGALTAERGTAQAMDQGIRAAIVITEFSRERARVVSSGSSSWQS